MKAIIDVLFFVACAVMVFLGFAWPFVIDTAPDDPSLRVFALGAFITYLLTMIFKIYFRMRGD